MTATDAKPTDILERIRELLDESLQLARAEEFAAIDERCEQMQTLIAELVENAPPLSPEMESAAREVIESYDRLRLQLAAARAGYTNGLTKMGKGRSSIRAYQSPDAAQGKLNGPGV
jgi:uncharacterized membrane protein YccC